MVSIVDFDEQATDLFCTINPLQFELSVICEWLEKLSTNSYLFTDGDHLPKTCGDCANFSFDYFFRETKRRLTFYDRKGKHLSDEQQSRLNNVRAHLDKF